MKDREQIHIGTSGRHYDHWRGVFYPQGLSKRRFLEYYARSFGTAARIVSDLPRSVSAMVKGEQDRSKLPGIGKDLAGKIKEIVETGTLKRLEEIEGRTSLELSTLMKVEGLGPKRVKALYENLGITNLKELKKLLARR